MGTLDSMLRDVDVCLCSNVCDCVCWSVSVCMWLLYVPFGVYVPLAECGLVCLSTLSLSERLDERYELVFIVRICFAEFAIFEPAKEIYTLFSVLDTSYNFLPFDVHCRFKWIIAP